MKTVKILSGLKKKTQVKVLGKMCWEAVLDNWQCPSHIILQLWKAVNMGERYNVKISDEMYDITEPFCWEI